MKQLLTFFTLAFLISWIIWLPSYGHIFGLNNLPALPSQHPIGALGPLIASLLTTCIFLKKDGIKKLISKCFKTKPLVYLAIALLSPLVFMWLLRSLFGYRSKWYLSTSSIGYIQFICFMPSQFYLWLYCHKSKSYKK